MALLDRILPTDTRPPRLGLRDTRAFSEDLVHTPLALHARYGDIFYMPIGPGLVPLYLTRDPDHVREVLVTRRKYYRRGIAMQRLHGIFGRGILVAEGDAWKRRRRMMAPAFMPKALSHFTEVFVQKTDEALERIQPNQAFESNAWTMQLTLDIALECLFGAELGDKPERVARAVEDGLVYVDSILRKVIEPLPLWVPTRHTRLRAHAMQTLYDVVDEIIEERRQSTQEHHDLLALLLAARDEQGSGFTHEELREEIITLLLAGHETTALHIAYTLMLLGYNADATQDVQREVDTVFQGRAPQTDDMRNVPQINAAVHESLRMYPPASVMTRQATQQEQLGVYTIPKDAQVMIPIRAIHHDPRWYPNPETFDLSRWTPDAQKSRPRYSFVPFGGGHRVCIGEHFARLEAQVVLARILQRFTPHTPMNEPPPLKLTITLRPLEPIMLELRTRSHANVGGVL